MEFGLVCVTDTMTREGGVCVCVVFGEEEGGAVDEVNGTSDERKKTMEGR